MKNKLRRLLSVLLTVMVLLIAVLPFSAPVHALPGYPSMTGTYDHPYGTFGRPWLRSVDTNAKYARISEIDIDMVDNLDQTVDVVIEIYWNNGTDDAASNLGFGALGIGAKPYIALIDVDPLIGGINASFTGFVGFDHLGNASYIKGTITGMVKDGGNWYYFTSRMKVNKT